MSGYQDRFFELTRRLVPPLGFYAELWRSPTEEPDLPALEAERTGRHTLGPHVRGGA